METGDLPKVAPVTTSPRSILAWKDGWRNESHQCASLESSNSLPRASSGEIGSRTPTTPPLQPERRPGRNLSNPVSPSSPGGPVAAIDKWRSLPSTPIDKVLQYGGDEDDHGTQGSVQWESAWHRGRSTAQSKYTPLDHAISRTSSINECPSTCEDEISEYTAGEDSWSVSSSSAASTTAVLRGGDRLVHKRVHFIDSLGEELASLKSCAKRAVDLGKKAQRYAAAEVSQLRREKANADAKARKFLELNHALKQQVLALRDENQKHQTERQLEMLAMEHMREKLEMERDNLLIAVRDEKKKRERAQREKDSMRIAMLDERMKFEEERRVNAIALREEREKVEALGRERDAAVKSLQDGTEMLDAERDVMLEAMRDLSTRLEFERDAKLRSMRRSSMDVCVANMNSPDNKISRRKGIMKNI